MFWVSALTLQSFKLYFNALNFFLKEKEKYVAGLATFLSQYLKV